jgi:TPP-dependent pyruvate/acetoin dehydrogenase alpha subunit
MTAHEQLKREQLLAFLGEQVYRDKDKLEELRETRDPIENLRRRLELKDTEWSDLDAKAQQVVDASVAFAQAGTDPNPDDALKYVYAPTPPMNAPTGAERQR